MELVCEIHDGDVITDDFNLKFLKQKMVCCNVSAFNILAFSSSPYHSNDRTQNSCQVRVCDLNSLWSTYLVTTTESFVTNLLWDRSGRKLLIADRSGQCQLWAMKDNMINKWEMLSMMDLTGEFILALSWFQSGLTLSLNADRKDSCLYSDKFTTSLHTPTLKNFGGRPLDGFIAVTASGMIGVAVIDPMDSTLQTVINSLGTTHNRFMIANIGHRRDGNMMVVCSNGLLSSLIHCYMIGLTRSKSTEITSHAAPSFYAKGDKNVDQITHVCFTSVSNAETLLVATKTADSSSSIQMWNLVQQNVLLHTVFQSHTPSSLDLKYKTLAWMHHITLTHTSPLVDLAPSQMSLTQLVPESTSVASTTPNITTYICAVFDDNAMYLIQPQTGHILTQSELDQDFVKSDGVKSNRAISQTVSGCGLVLVTNDGVQLYRLVNERDQVMYVSPSQLVLLIEYTLITGFDYYDVLLIMKPNMVEGILQKLCDTFYKQPAAVQAQYQMRFLSIKLAVYILMGSGNTKIEDTRTELILFGIQTAIAGTLRPQTVSPQSLTAREYLQSTMSKIEETDIDKIIFSLEKQDFFLDPVILLSLQHLMQWVADLVLNLLILISHPSNQSETPGYSFLRDASFLQTLREILVMIRIWSKLHQPSEPKFITTGNYDCLGVIFSLLTRVWLCVRNGVDIDDAIVDACSILTTKIFTQPPEQPHYERQSIGFYSQSTPIRLSTNQTPQSAYPDKSTNQRTSLTNRRNYKDIIHLTNLGSNLAYGVKKCVRCLSLTSPVTRSPKAGILSPPLRAWEMRWSKQCLCSGLWKFVESNEF